MFSTTEEKVLKIIGKKKMSITQVVKDFYKGKKPVLNPNNYIAQVIRGINQKCEYNELNWKIEGEGLGRGGRTVWKAHKK